MDRAREIREERLQPVLEKIWGKTDDADGADAQTHPAAARQPINIGEKRI